MKEAALRSQEFDTDQSQYVTFSLNDEVYGIDALSVQEIVELTSITRVPHLPDFMKGVINLRGTIIPVVDLKTKFNMKTGPYKKHTCIIVTEFKDSLMGLIVDDVFDVLSVPRSSIQTTPEFGAKIRTDFIRGLLRAGDKLIIILDINKVLSEEEKNIIHEAVKEETGGNNEAEV
ncbi:MAG: chemotaxis protein CheW [Thermodesulfovibrionales bacterium]|nr:chemotaxis protein CheW [Thermodesulfovibrionales bacterium]